MQNRKLPLGSGRQGPLVSGHTIPLVSTQKLIILTESSPCEKLACPRMHVLLPQYYEVDQALPGELS